MKDSTQWKIAWTVFLTCLIIIFCLSYFKGCDKQTDSSIKSDTLTINQTRNADSIRIYNLAVKTISDRVDTNKQVKTVIKTRIVHHYQTLYDTIPIYLRDDLDSIQDTWMDLEIVNLNIIGDQDSIIQYQQKEIGIYKAITHNDTLRIVDLESQIKSSEKYWCGFRTGILAGIGISGALFIGSKIKP